MSQYVSYTVEYRLDEHQAAQLEEIRKAWIARGNAVTSEQIFENLMREGSVYDVAEKLAYAEWRYGLRDSFPLRDKVYEETKARLNAESNESEKAKSLE